MKFPHFPQLNGSKPCLNGGGFIAILAALFSLCLQPCLAEQSGLSLDVLKYVKWISGPQNFTLGGVADLNLPYDCRITDSDDGRMILAGLNDPIPDDLVAILAPVSGKWMAILEYSPAGYVKKPDLAKIDANAVLQQALNEMTGKSGESSLTSLSWQSQPTYDAGKHLLTWSFQVVSPSGKLLSQTAVLFGRHGILQVTVAQPASLGSAPLNQVVSNISFKDGERYADYQKGDKVVQIALADLISGAKPAQAAESSGGNFGTVAAWIYGGLGICVIAGGLMMVFRRKKTRVRRWRTRVPVSAHVHPKPVSNHRHGSKSFRRRHHKRVFDFTKFYAKVMRELYRQPYSAPHTTNGKSWSNGHVNGHENGDPNGHATSHSNGHAASNSSDANVNQFIKSEIEELIAAQKILIEEQKHIMEQQARLIEEKREPIDDHAAPARAIS